MNFKELIKNVAIRIVDKKIGPVALTLHHIPNAEFVWLEKFLDELIKDYEFLNPADMINHRKLTGNKILLTFDDGLLSQKNVAKEILDPRGLKGLFFVPSGFINLQGDKAFNFAKTRFFPDSYPQDLSYNAYNAMSWDDIKFLIDSGHSIGGHTHSHPKLSSLAHLQQVEEIVGSADMLSNELSIPIEQFAYPFGSMAAVDRGSVKIAKDRFKIAYSNIRGMINDQVNQSFLFRQNIVPGMPLWMARAALEGRMDWWYKRVRKKAY